MYVRSTTALYATHRLLVGVAVAYLCFLSSPLRGQESWVTVEARSDRTVVENLQTFSLDTNIRNADRQIHDLLVWSCTYSKHWLTSSSVVRLDPESCRKNLIIRVRLRPGQAYRKALSIRVALPRPADQPVTFQFGFQPLTRPASPQAAPVVWSNPIVITITDAAR